MMCICVGPCALKKMHSSCLLFFSVAGLLFTVSLTTIVSIYANVTESYFILPLIISLLPLITAVHYVHFLIWRLSVISTGGGIYHFSLVCLFSLVSFSVLTACYFSGLAW